MKALTLKEVLENAANRKLTPLLVDKTCWQIDCWPVSLFDENPLGTQLAIEHKSVCLSLSQLINKGK